MTVPHVRLGFRHRMGLYCQQPSYRRSGFVSFSGVVDGHARGQDGSNEPHTSDISNFDLEKIAPNGLQLRTPWRHKLPRPYGVDKKLEGLFSASQNQSEKRHNLRYSDGPVSTDNAFEVLHDMLNEGNLIPEHLWAQLEEVIRTNAWKTSVFKDTEDKDVKFKGIIFRELLLQLCKVRSREPFRLSVPTPAKMIRIYRKHGLMEYWWEEILWIQLGVLFDWGRKTLRTSRPGEVPAHENLSRLTGDTLEVWEVFMEEYGNRMTSSSVQKHDPDPPNLSSCDTSMPATMRTAQRISTGWQGLPTSADIKFRSVQAPAEKVHRFLHYLPNHPNVRETIRVAEAALLTRDCIRFFTTKHLITEPVTDFAEPFLQLMEQIFQERKLDAQLSFLCLGEQRIPYQDVSAVFHAWGITTEPKNVSDETISSLTPSRFANVKSEWKNDRYSLLLTKLRRAVERSDLSYLTELWQGFQSMPGLAKSDENLLQILYLRFLVAFFSFARPEDATTVWNHMIKSGHVPNQKHWNAMLSGCAKAMDLVSLQGVWSNMKTAGFEPDNYAWATWIGGLIICGEIQQGLQALKDLGEIWKTSVPSDDKSGSVKFEPREPSIVPINAAISACLASRRTELFPLILRWAESKKFPLDTSTFNIMLAPLVRKADHASVDALLASMQRHGCSPDVVTMTIILNGLMHSPASAFSTMSPTDQNDAILKILHKMEKQGLPATVQTYCTILDGLLRPEKANLLAAHTVLDHMAKKKMKPSSSICTILATHYFGMRPPDLAAVDALWQRMRSDKVVRDRFFFDRMIEGYARCGEVEKMLLLLTDALAEGKSPSWMALSAMVIALKRVREWDVISDLVTDVLDVKNGILRHGESSPSGKGRFWTLIDELLEGGHVQLRDQNQGSGGLELKMKEKPARKLDLN
jgi:pentatricopeptide repeat protein